MVRRFARRSCPTHLFVNIAAQLSVVQARLGVQLSTELLENAIGRIAKGLAERGVTSFVAAGGETSGAVVTALDLTGGTIGPEVARGVPWISTPDGLYLLLKSRNFGDVEFLIGASAGPRGECRGRESSAALPNN